MWSDSEKDRFFDAVKSGVIAGATPEDMFRELQQCYYTALDDLKSAAHYAFEHIGRK